MKTVAIDLNKPVAVEPIEKHGAEDLSHSGGLKLLQECELVIKNGQQTFYQVAMALLTIRSRRLYKLKKNPKTNVCYTDFDIYCKQEWGFSKQTASNKILGAMQIDIESSVKPSTGVDTTLGSSAPAPKPKTQTQLKKERQQKVWEQRNSSEEKTLKQDTGYIQDSVKEIHELCLVRHKGNLDLIKLLKPLAELYANKILNKPIAETSLPL